MLEDRKQKEIEHSRKRREILQGFERISDTHVAEQAEDLEALIKDPDAFKYYFANMKYYSITRKSDEFQTRWLADRCSSSVHALDFACGNGENGIKAASFGADTTGIDISPEGVANANLNAEEAGVADHCRFLEMDGEAMTFEDDTFDIGVEYGALHHVDLDKALSELSRVIKPDGEMICIEAIRHNPFIHLYRKMTPHLRTQWEVEHILGVESLDLMRQHFGRVQARFFHLAALLAVPFRRTSLFQPMLSSLDRLDDFLLSNQTIGKYGWLMIVELGDPIRPQ